MFSSSSSSSPKSTIGVKAYLSEKRLQQVRICDDRKSSEHPRKSSEHPRNSSEVFQIFVSDVWNLSKGNQALFDWGPSICRGVVIKTVNQKKGKCTGRQWELKEETSIQLEARERARTREWRSHNLFLSSHLVGLKSGTSFLDESCRTVIRSQWEVTLKTSAPIRARENASNQFPNWWNFTSDWLQGWRQFFEQ